MSSIGAGGGHILMRYYDCSSKDVSVKVWENEDKIEKDNLRTCGFCYKVFARIRGRKLHELMKHNSYD